MRKATANTLNHLLGAMYAQRAVTIRYAKPVKGGTEISVRRIEIHSIEVSSAGNILIECYDHRSADRHTFRLDRITDYTLHRAPKLARYTAPTVAAPTVSSSIDPTTGDEDMVTGFRAWDFAFNLAA